MNSLFTYLKFETALLKSKLSVINIILVVVVILAFFSIHKLQVDTEYSQLNKLYDFTEADRQSNLSTVSLESFLQAGYSEEEAEKQYQEMLKETDEYGKELLGVSNSIKDKTFTDFYQFQLKNFELFSETEYAEYSRRNDFFKGSFQNFESYKNGQKVLFQELTDRKLPLENPRYGISNWLYSLSFFQYLCSPLGIAALLILIGSIHLSKYEKRTISLLTTQPISKRAIIIGDGLLFFLFSVLFLAFIFLCCFILGTFAGGKIPMDYPVLTRSSGNLVILPVSKLLIQNAVLLIAVLNIVYQICYGLSILLRKQFLACFLSIGIITALNLFSISSPLVSTDIASVNPFSYMNPFSLFIVNSNERIDFFQLNYSLLMTDNLDYYTGKNLNFFNSTFNYQSGAVSLIVCFLLLLFLNQHIVKKKRM